ncbi:MAG: fibrobacter succinogenes major paralogous domain-containing protein [Fibromonadales bacterium]|nr:fibrobacter succinogenes major paralogous domain-containing protein [Fibromonadales bacterium]
MYIRLNIEGKEYEGNLSQVLQPVMGKAFSKTGNFETYVDKRDGQSYKYVKIGSQAWMTQNLNYEIDDSFCYNNNPEQAELYGRLYTWAAALGVCPLGWHLPSKAEWLKLVEFIGIHSAATALKSISGWVGESTGTDEYGFAALPAGYRSELNRDFHHQGKLAGWWTSSELSADKACAVRVNSNAVQIQTEEYSKLSAFSVRCIKD